MRKLDRLKRPGESYSDVIDRHLPPLRPLSELADYIREHPVAGPDDLTHRVQEIRRLLNKPRRGA